LFVYVVFYLGQLSHFRSCFGSGTGVTTLNEPRSSFLFPPHYCRFGAGPSLLGQLIVLVITFMMVSMQCGQFVICCSCTHCAPPCSSICTNGGACARPPALWSQRQCKYCTNWRHLCRMSFCCRVLTLSSISL